MIKQFVKTVFNNQDWQTMPSLGNWVVDEGVRIQQIPAPTFHEDERADYVAEQFARYGLSDVETDDLKNVYGILHGRTTAAPQLVVMAHTDTVFAMETDLTVQYEGDLIYGPGLGDNSIGVAGMLGLIKWLHDTGTVPACDICFVASSCEEGLGDLKGIRAAYAKLEHSIGMIINLEGLALGHIYHAGIAVHRLHITARAAGGHSWLYFGRPSAIQGVIELGSQINRLSPPTSPRTTYNIGMITGGSAINAISTEAHLWLDMRSEAQATLHDLRQQVLKIIASLEHPELQFDIEVVGDRPAGSLHSDHPLVQGALATLQQLGIRGTLETGSTDGNIPLAAGCPTITIGITRGGHAHRLDEYIEVSPVITGMKQLITLSLAITNYQEWAYQQSDQSY